MMKNLILSEWERLFSRKSIWGIFILMPLLVVVTAVFFRNQNPSISPDQVDYATAINFSVLGLSEHLFITFNVILLLLVGYVMTEEYQKGHLRLLLLRSYSMAQIFVSKIVVLGLSLLLFLGVYLISAVIVGSILFDVPLQSTMFITEDVISNRAMLFYTFYYYVLAYLTGLSMLSLLIFVGIISPSINTLLGVGFSFLFFSIAVPQLLEYSTAFGGDSSIVTMIAYSSITQIQYAGITLLLAGWEYGYWIVGVTLLYIVGFLTLSYLIFTKRSYFI